MRNKERFVTIMSGIIILFVGLLILNFLKVEIGYTKHESFFAKGSENDSGRYEKIYGCDVDNITSLSGSIVSDYPYLCQIVSLSGYSKKNLIVVDKISDNKFVIRILELVGDKKEVYREEIERDYDFDMYFSYFPLDSDEEKVIIIDNNGSIFVGFPGKTSGEYKIIWKR